MSHLPITSILNRRSDMLFAFQMSLTKQLLSIEYQSNTKQLQEIY